MGAILQQCQVMRGSDGAPEPDPNHPPYFRVSAELLGRMLHTFKRQYVDDDLKRITCDILTSHITAETEYAKVKVSQAAQSIRIETFACFKTEKALFFPIQKKLTCRYWTIIKIMTKIKIRF